MTEPQHLVTARPAKQWAEMTEAEKQAFIDNIYTKMKTAAKRFG